MKKLLLAMLAVLTLTMLSSAALAVDYTIPDPEHFFGQRMEETRKNNYVMYFDEDPGDMYDAYMALLLNDYNMYDMEILPRSRIFSKVGVERQGMTIKYSADDEGYSITFAIPPIMQLEKREQYSPNWADAQEVSGIVLPHPGYYFGDDYFYTGGSITFDEYPKAEFDAYTALLTEKYGLEITKEYHGKSKEYYHMTVPGVDNALVYVACVYDSQGYGSGNSLKIEFSGGITLGELDVYTASSACDLCGGDGLCDTCGGKGYLEMKAYGSKDTVRVACTGGCAEGKCLSCAPDAATLDTKVYKAPIVGNDGLLVMSPEQYLGIDPCDELQVGDDGSYIYYYAEKGAEWYGRGSDAEWAKLESYVQALIDSGYYMEDGYKKSNYATHWYLRYVGPAMESSDAADIHVHCTGGRAYVSYRHPYVATDDLEEKLIYFNLDDPIPNPDDPTPTTRPNYPTNDKTRCSNCGGDGETNCMSCSGKGYNTCGGCNGSGDRRCGSCNGTGTNGSRNCTTCSGRGRKTCSSCSGSGKRNCTACSGDGKKSCSSCGGDGYK